MKKIAFVLLLFSGSCAAPRVTTTNVTKRDNLVIDGKIFVTAFQQRSAEYRALCYQAFNIARIKLAEFNHERSLKPRAIMTDIDETILNNSPYEAHQILQGKDYDADSWREWTAMGKADTLPGALHFLQFAFASGVEIFYVSNRGEDEREGTLKNLQHFNFPNADDAHLLLKQETSSKELRKNTISNTHNIVLLMGDNLNDFSNLFEKKSSDERENVADNFSAEFGNRFIVLPNPVYGDWESSLYHYDYSLTPAQKDSIIKSAVKGY
ncbi:5'-nucleotidase, lipoprotein e(P4) family [Hanamia caeni]|nr:5'-nucleotidase, lipoprotein e(P4) family [Hanamia caeni]